MLHSFTEEAIQILNTQGGSRGSSEMVRIIDDAHQQMRNHLKRVQRPGLKSNRSFGNRESPCQSDHDTEPESRSKKQDGKSQQEEMLILKIDKVPDIDEEQLSQDEEDMDLQTSEQHQQTSQKEPQSPTLKELEIIEEQNEQDNQSDSGEATSLLEVKNNPSIVITFVSP